MSTVPSFTFWNLPSAAEYSTRAAQEQAKGRQVGPLLMSQGLYGFISAITPEGLERGLSIFKRKGWKEVTPPPPATPPQAAFAAFPTSGTVPLTVQFQDLSQGTVTSRYWLFGDGGSSNEVSPSHTYTSPGEYTITLTVTGPGGTSVTAAVLKVLAPAPPEPPEEAEMQIVMVKVTRGQPSGILEEVTVEKPDGSQWQGQVLGTLTVPDTLQSAP